MANRVSANDFWVEERPFISSIGPEYAEDWQRSRVSQATLIHGLACEGGDELDAVASNARNC